MPCVWLLYEFNDNVAAQTSKVNFFPLRRAAWLALLPGDLTGEQVGSSYVCSLHFWPKDIQHNRERTTLSPNAVPSRSICKGNNACTALCFCNFIPIFTMVDPLGGGMATISSNKLTQLATMGEGVLHFLKVAILNQIELTSLKWPCNLCSGETSFSCKTSSFRHNRPQIWDFPPKRCKKQPWVVILGAKKTTFGL